MRTCKTSVTVVTLFIASIMGIGTAVAQESAGTQAPGYSALGAGHMSLEGGMWIHDLYDKNVVGVNFEGRFALPGNLELGLGSGLMPAFGRALGLPVRLSDNAGLMDVQVYGGQWISGGTTFIGAMANLPLEDGSHFLFSLFGRTARPLGGSLYFLGDAGASISFGDDLNVFGLGVDLGVYAAITARAGFMAQFGAHYYIPDDSHLDSDLNLPLRLRGLYEIAPAMNIYGEVFFMDLNDMGGDSILYMVGIQKTM